MGYIWWIVAGFVCLGVSSFIGSIGDLGATPSDRLPFYIGAIAVLTVGAYCFVRGGKETWLAIMVQTGEAPPPPEEKASPKPAPTAKVQPARRLADSDHETAADDSDFDADAALARYLARRDQAPAEAEAPTAQASEVRPARRIADSNKRSQDDQGDFDPDAALARYMSRREANVSETPADPALAEAPAQPFPPELRPAVRPTFGRKVS